MMVQFVKKIGRNDPCYCGSQKKYKKCCLHKEEKIKHLPSRTAWRASVQDPDWIKIRETERDIFQKHLLPFLTSSLSKNTLEDAWEDFTLSETWPKEMETSTKEAMFMEWLFFNWIPYDPPYHPIAQTYLTAHKNSLTDYEKKFMEALCESYYSFYVVLSVQTNKCIVLKDILLKTEHTVKEYAGTHKLKRGDVIYNRLLCLEGQQISIGMGPFILPTNFYFMLLDIIPKLKKSLGVKTITRDHLKESADDLRELFFYKARLSLQPQHPTLYNTDQELVVDCTLIFDLALSPIMAFEKLIHLNLVESPREALQSASRDTSGAVTHVTIDWHKHGNKVHKEWPNTIMGQIEISPNRLRINVNSEARAEKAQKLIKTCLGDAATYRETIKKTQDTFLKTTSLETEDSDSEMLNALDNLNTFPEAQTLIKNFARSYWDSWLDTPIPFLKNKTPRKAATTPAARERLEALLLLYERQSVNKNSPFDADIAYLKQQLFLA